VFVNVNLAGPQATDRNVGVLYGTIDLGGMASPVTHVVPDRGIIDLVNMSSGHSVQVSAQLEKEFENDRG
jgi:hypothetical protein